jgi:hypothetical protein
MAFFDKFKNSKKQASTPEQSGRRRPSIEEQAGKRTQAFSYYAQRSTTPTNTGRGQGMDNADKTTSEPRLWYQNRVFVTVGLVILLGIILFMTTLSGKPKLVALTSGGNGTFLQDMTVYQQTAEQSLQHSIFNKNKFTLDAASISHDLLTHYPELEDVTVATPLLGHQTVVYVTPSSPSFLLSTLDNKVFLLDINGRALASNGQITSMRDVQVPTIEDKSGISVKLGGQALPAGTVHFTQTVLSILAAKQMSYTQLVLPPASSELDVYITGKPYFIKFNIQGDAKQETGTYLATIQRLEKDKITPGQYIDVRVNERAYYK